ncbi:MAG: hypothetical protein IKP27_08000 [Paludibacteraceae bacterium]|nr:hypothetical protein [Paludibacteraceae bacterium]
MNDAENEKITSEWLKANTKISGWLVFFLAVVMGIGGLKRGLTLIAVNMSDYDNIFCLAAVDIFTGIVFIGISAYVIYSFLNRYPNAVFWARVNLILIIVLVLWNLVVGLIVDVLPTEHEKINAVSGLLGGGLWLLYLALSQQVQEVIPKSFRKVSNADWIVLAAIILIHIVLFVIGVVQLVASATDSQGIEVIEEVSQNAGSLNYEETEQVKFIVPKEFSCDASLAYDIEGKDLYAYDLADEVNFFSMATLCSEYKADSSLSNLDRHWEAWKKRNIKRSL